MDCFLIEGVRALYRIAMAILILFVQEHASEFPAESFMARVFSGKKGKGKGGCSGDQSPDTGRFLDRIIVFCRDMPFDVDKFLKTAYNIQGVSAKVLNDQLLKSEAVVKSSASSRLRSATETGVTVSPSGSYLQVTSSCLSVKDNKFNAASRAMSPGIMPVSNFRSEVLSAQQVRRATCADACWRMEISAKPWSVPQKQGSLVHRLLRKRPEKSVACRPHYLNEIGNLSQRVP
ncbi:hypothetical protein V5799_032375 [Amblyomma americanum]|uniref:Uncharacterized protein n=1 Tax=Amblyomma americanum TaxID=6943 RepID=A0AAQ4DRC6_AMBAM